MFAPINGANILDNFVKLADQLVIFRIKIAHHLLSPERESYVFVAGKVSNEFGQGGTGHKRNFH